MTVGAEASLGTLAPLATVPRHVAIIMDGNGRWALARGLPRLEGHRAGTENIRPIVEACAELGIQALTLFAFSTENWKRPASEIEGLFSLLAAVIERETEELHRNGIQIRHLGSLDNVPPDLAESIRKAVARTQANSQLIVSVAFNYGARAEIVHAVQAIIRAGIPPDQVTEDHVNAYLYTASLPELDLVIRTAGEMRLSNFLLWQAAYAEYWSTPDCWPDFSRQHLQAAVADFARRQRRFGSL
jgi:undecaprenyl diphosphate synthase